MTFQTAKEQRLAAILARRQTPEFAKAGDRLIAKRQADAKAAAEQRAWDKLPFDTKVEVGLYEVHVGFEDVRGDNPEVECGWEWDVARSLLTGYERNVRIEVLRLLGLEEG